MEERCYKCDRIIFPGQRKYLVSVRITPDPDSEASATLLEPGVEAVFCSSDTGFCLLPGEDDTVNMAFTLCARCRRHYGENPLATAVAARLRPALLH